MANRSNNRISLPKSPPLSHRRCSASISVSVLGVVSSPSSTTADNESSKELANEGDHDEPECVAQSSRSGIDVVNAISGGDEEDAVDDECDEGDESGEPGGYCSDDIDDDVTRKSE